MTRLLTRILIILLTAGVVFHVRNIRTSTPEAGHAGSPHFHRQSARGLSYRALPIQSDGKSGVLHVLKVDVKRWEVRVLRTSDLGMEVATVDTIAQRTKARAVINGGFFDQNSRPLGLVVIARKLRNPMHPADWGVFFLRNGRPHIVHSHDYRRGRESYALQSGPRLVVHGRITSLKPRKAFRSAVGITSEGHVVLIATENIALDLREFAEILARPESRHGVGCVDALNLDGGPSTQFYVNSPPWRLNLPGGWGVPTAIGVFPRKS